jgi:glycine cleavage system H protein
MINPKSRVEVQMKTDPNARYAKSHEWVRMDASRDVAVCGISDHAQSQLSDLVYVELPAVGKSFSQGQSFGVIESVKAASDLYMPMDGTIIAANEALPDEPGQINADAFAAWFIKFKPANPAQFDALMDAAAYEAFCAAEAH